MVAQVLWAMEEDRQVLHCPGGFLHATHCPATSPIPGSVSLGGGPEAGTGAPATEPGPSSIQAAHLGWCPLVPCLLRAPNWEMAPTGPLEGEQAGQQPPSPLLSPQATSLTAVSVPIVVPAEAGVPGTFSLALCHRCHQPNIPLHIHQPHFCK